MRGDRQVKPCKANPLGNVHSCKGVTQAHRTCGRPRDREAQSWSFPCACGEPEWSYRARRSKCGNRSRRGPRKHAAIDPGATTWRTTEPTGRGDDSVLPGAAALPQRPRSTTYGTAPPQLRSDTLDRTRPRLRRRTAPIAATDSVSTRSPEEPRQGDLSLRQGYRIWRSRSSGARPDRAATFKSFGPRRSSDAS